MIPIINDTNQCKDISYTTGNTVLSGTAENKGLKALECRFVGTAISYDIACNTRKGAFRHLRKVSFQISLRSPRRLI